MPKLTTGKKITLKTLEKHLRTAQGVPIPKTGNLKGITRNALKRIYEMHLDGEIKFKTDTQERLKAYAKDYVPKRGRPRKEEVEAEAESVEVETADSE